MAYSHGEVADTGGTQRLQKLLQKLRKELPSVLQGVAEHMAAEAAEHAPSPEVEYDTMMTGDGNPDGITNIPPMPLSPSDSDGDHRLRFYKPPGFYLQPFISRNFFVDGLQIGLGNATELNIASQYVWRNVTGDEFTSTVPFWEAWEYGMQGTFIVKPRIPTNNKGFPTTLKPAPGKDNERYFMSKSIPRLRMYGSVDVDAHIKNEIIPAVRKIASQA